MARPASAFASAVAVLASCLALPRESDAIPAFARRHELSCRACHRGHFPNLGPLGRRFRESGYQLPDGTDDVRGTFEPGTVAERLSVLRDVPLGIRGQVFGVAPLDAEAQGTSPFDTRVFAFLFGGGSVYEDVSFFFSFTPFPEPALHHARAGLHDLFERVIGEGTLNLRAGALLLLDFTRPSHRFLSPGAALADSVRAGLNGFALGDATLGAELYGRPGLGPFAYQVAVVAGDPGEGVERDDFKDGFLRLSYTFFQDSDHELIAGAFGYLGRSRIEAQLGGVAVALLDAFWIAGADLELALGPFDVHALALASRHGDARPSGEPIGYVAGRLEIDWTPLADLVASARVEMVRSRDAPELDAAVVQAHVAYLIATNVLASVAWRQDLQAAERSLGIAALDAAF